MREFKDTLSDLEKLIDQGRELQIITLLSSLYPADIADLVDALEDEEKKKLFGLLDIQTASDVISEIDEISRARLPWLITNLFGGIITGYFLWLFKVTVKDVLALITFIPVITAMGGNVGIQTSSIMVRGIAIKKVQLTNMLDNVLKELKVGAIIGLTCGIVAGSVASVWHHKPLLGVVVGIAMFFAITVAAITGAIVPLVFKKNKIDPAIASGPFVTTANDITGILIYMLTATVLLKFLT